MSVFYFATPISDALPRQIQNPPPLVEVDGKNEYFVEKVDDIKYNK